MKRSRAATNASARLISYANALWGQGNWIESFSQPTESGAITITLSPICDIKSTLRPQSQQASTQEPSTTEGVVGNGEDR